MASQITVAQLLACATARIASQPDLPHSAPALEARLLFEFVTDKHHSWQITHANDTVDASVVSQFEQGVNQRLAGMPLAFIIGTQAFWTLELEVDSCTLIPRQDTEILVDAALELSFASNSSSSDRTEVLDLGTGTGAIALALAKERPAWNVMGVDRIAAAVALAKRNATRNGIKAAFVQSDWFSAVKGKQFNLVVSNPPYVETNSVYLTQGDLRFEPASALSSGEDGLNDIRIIIEQSLVHLHPSGWLVMEHGAAQAQAISDLLRQQGYVQIVTKTDYNDLARVTLAQKPE